MEMGFFFGCFLTDFSRFFESGHRERIAGKCLFFSFSADIMGRDFCMNFPAFLAENFREIGLKKFV